MTRPSTGAYWRQRAVFVCPDCGGPLEHPAVGRPRDRCPRCAEDRRLRMAIAWGNVLWDVKLRCARCNDGIRWLRRDDPAQAREGEVHCAACASDLDAAPAWPIVPLYVGGSGVVYDGGPLKTGNRIHPACSAAGCGKPTRTEGNGRRSCLAGHVTRIEGERP